MLSYTRDLVRAGLSSAGSGTVTRQARKAHFRKIPYRVGYTWNKGGRLKELRIRHLARKFLKIWIHNTFGRVLPHEAKSHYNRVVLRRTFEGWRDEWWMSRREWSLTMRAECHYRHYLYNWTLHRWRRFVHLKREKKTIMQNVQLFADKQRMRLVWDRWKNFINMKRMKNRMRESALEQNRRSTMHSAWSLWQTRLQQHRECRPLEDQAVKNYSILLLRSCFQHWRKKLAELRNMQELERRADIWFVECTLPRCFKSWVEFTQRRRLHEQRKLKAEVFNRQRQYSWVFYTWWGQSEKHKEEMLSERMAILHEERGHMQRAWDQWRQRTQQQIEEVEKQDISHRLYMYRLLHKTMTQWKNNSTEIQDRRNREQQAFYQCDLRRMRSAVEKWKKFVQSQRVKKSRLKEIQRYHEIKLLKHSFGAWKKHHLQMSRIYDHVEELYTQQTRCFLRNVLTVWRKNAALLAEIHTAEQQAQNYFEHFLQLKVFLAWRGATIRAVSKRHQQEEALSRAQRSMRQVRLRRSFRHWRNQNRQARRERMWMEKARRHYDAKLLSKTLKAWNRHHLQHQKNKVMKRQGIMLLKLKIYQTYFEEWKIKLHHRRRENKQMERALWHWSLTLQAKVLYGWRLWATEKHRKQEEAAKAAQVYRDQLLREGVTCILTYAAHMNDLTTNLTLHNQEQKSQRLQRVVKRCAMRWKQRALGKPRREQEVRVQTQKKSVTFCLPPMTSIPSSDTVEQEAEDGLLSKLLLTRMPRRQPRRCKELFEAPLKMLPDKGSQNQYGITSTEAKPFEFSHPSQKGHPVVSSCPPVTSAHQSTFISTVSLSEPHMSTRDSPQETQNHDPLLPPSAFMTTRAQNTLGKSSSSGPGEPPHVSFHQFDSSFKHHSSTYPETHLRASSGESEGRHADAATDSTSTLLRELLIIQLDMKSFQQSRKQLRAWRKLKEVLQSWLQTSGKDEQMEKNAVSQELKELEERIGRLSAELEKQKPTMQLHTERVQHLQSVLQTSGVYSLCRKVAEMET